MGAQKGRQMFAAELRTFETVERARAVLEEFVGHGAPWGEHTLYLPPWRERLLDGRLGPEHGPYTQAEYEREWKSWGETRQAGSLWDGEEDERMRTRTGSATRTERVVIERYDAAQMRVYVEHHSHEIPPGELAVYCLYFVDMCSRAVTARKLGVSSSTVCNQIKSLRRRLRDRQDRRNA